MTRAQITNAVVAEIAAERERQVNVEGYSDSHDDEHKKHELADAAACYAVCPADKPGGGKRRGWIFRFWPWAHEEFKPEDKRRNLIKATALLIAEIERIDRASGK